MDDNNQLMACYSNWMQNVSLNGKSIFPGKDFPYLHMNPTLIGLLIDSDTGEPGFKGVLYAFLPHTLALIVTIVLLSRFLHWFLRCLKQPLIICQLIAGILLFSFLRKDGNNNDGGIIIHPENRRLSHAIAKFGLLFNLFNTGLNFNFSQLFQYKKKEPLIIAFGSMAVPFIVGVIFAYTKYKELGFSDLRQQELIFYVVYVLCGTYPVGVYEILSELDLLNSELGRLALSASMSQLIVAWVCIMAYIIIQQGQERIFMGFVSAMSYAGLIIFIGLVVRPYVLWVIRTTPSNARVSPVHIWTITFTVLLMGLLGDFFGLMSYADAAIVMGFIIPNGPPLGTAMTKQVDLVASHLLLPIIFLHQGFSVNWGILRQNLSIVLCLGFLVILMFIAKSIAIIASAMYCKMPPKKGFLLAVIMNFRGILDMLLLLNIENLHVIDQTTFSGLVLVTMPITAICSPLLATYYQPLGVTKEIELQTIEQTQSQGELSVLACFFDDKPIQALLEFLESSSFETKNSIYSLHLVELQGSHVSNLVYHDNNKKDFFSTLHMDPVHNHFLTLKTKGAKGVDVIPVTSVAPLNSMYQDICSVVLDNNVSFVIIPYPNKNSIANVEANTAMHGFLPLVLENAQCSVGIMVYNGATKIIDGESSWDYNVGVIFWGGPDDREAIAIASRIACHPNVQLNIIRFITSPSKTNENEFEDGDYQKVSDERMITELLAESEGNSRVKVSKITIEDATHIIDAISVIGKDKYDLLIIGRQQNCLSLFGDDWEKWTESPELGVIGDLVVSDISDTTDVLIVQQHSKTN